MPPCPTVAASLVRLCSRKLLNDVRRSQRSELFVPGEESVHLLRRILWQIPEDSTSVPVLLRATLRTLDTVSKAMQMAEREVEAKSGGAGGVALLSGFDREVLGLILELGGKAQQLEADVNMKNTTSTIGETTTDFW